jgi:predicted flavoprotein YhiN
VAVRSLAAGDAARILVAWSTDAAQEWEEALGAGDVLVRSALSRRLPERLADFLIACSGIPAYRRTSSLKRAERSRLIGRLTAFELPWSGHEGYAKAEVTGGGVSLTDVNPYTMESRRCAGLYLCGELLDAFGPIGGHNFAWAWSTGRAAGIAAAGG